MDCLKFLAAFIVLCLVPYLAPDWAEAQLPIGGTIGGAVNQKIREGQKALKQGQDNLNKAASQGGRAVANAPKTAAENAKAIADGIDHFGVEINKAAISTGEGLEHFGKEFNKEANKAGDSLSRAFCSIFTLGGSDRGAASCSVNAGVGKDNQGYYTFNPQTPDEKYRGNEQNPKNPDLEKFAKFVNQDLVLSHEEIRAAEDLRTLQYRRYLPGGYRLGKSWPDIENLKAPTKSGIIRGPDAGAVDGGGNFLAIRYDDRDGKHRIRYHSGTDYVTKAGDDVFSPVDGNIVRVQKPRKELDGVLIDHKGYTASVFYVQPAPEIADALKQHERVPVQAGQKIGTAEDITKVYGPRMTNHVHVSLRDPDGRFVSPDGKLTVLPATPTLPAASKQQ